MNYLKRLSLSTITILLVICSLSAAWADSNRLDPLPCSNKINRIDYYSSDLWRIPGPLLYHKRGPLKQNLKIYPQSFESLDWSLPKQSIRICSEDELQRERNAQKFMRMPETAPLAQALPAAKNVTQTRRSRVQKTAEEKPFIWPPRPLSGIYVKGGTGLINGVYDKGERSSGMFLLGGIGYHYERLLLSYDYRATVSNQTDHKAALQWHRFLVGYTFPLGSWQSFKPTLTALIGLEQIRNKLKSSRRITFIGSIRNRVLGPRFGFTYDRRWEGGATFFPGFAKGSSRMLRIYWQVDVSYWLTPSLLAGAAYWQDTYQRAPEFNRPYDKFSAPELFISYYF